MVMIMMAEILFKMEVLIVMVLACQCNVYSISPMLMRMFVAVETILRAMMMIVMVMVMTYQAVHYTETKKKTFMQLHNRKQSRPMGRLAR